MVSKQDVDDWYNSGCIGPDPRGPAPVGNYYYDYQLQAWRHINDC